jgi:hypothetical protein
MTQSRDADDQWLMEPGQQAGPAIAEDDRDAHDADRHDASDATRRRATSPPNGSGAGPRPGLVRIDDLGPGLDLGPDRSVDDPLPDVASLAAVTRFRRRRLAVGGVAVLIATLLVLGVGVLLQRGLPPGEDAATEGTSGTDEDVATDEAPEQDTATEEPAADDPTDGTATDDAATATEDAATDDGVTTAPPADAEPVDLEVGVAGVAATQATLTAHPWGTELRVGLVGLEENGTYHVQFEPVDGASVDVGSVAGAGPEEVVATFSGAVERDDLAAVVVRSDAGEEIARAQL